MPTVSYVVALTGGIGAGKSTVANLFARYGVHLVDTDALAHALTAAGGKAVDSLRREFGDGALDSNGALDRPRMRELAFKDVRARTRLEEILHPLIREEAEAELGSPSAIGAPYVMLAVPLLFETMGYRRRFNKSLVVDCPVELQRRRVQRRSGLAAQDVERILSSQLNRALRLQLGDDVVSNAGDVAALSSQVTRLHDRYAPLAGALR